MAVFAVAAAAAGPALLPWSARAADGTWSFNGSGLWSDTTAWVNGSIADGTDAIANFNSIDLAANATITLDGTRTVGSLIFGDLDPVATPATWTLATSTNTLTLAGTAPTITTNVNTTISGILAGTAGLTKQGVATLDIAGLTTPSTNLTGGLNIAAGTVRVKGNATLASVTPGGNISGGGTLVIGNASGNTASIDVDLSTFTGTLYSPAANTRWGTSSSAPAGTISAGGRNATFDLGAAGNLFYRNGTNGSITFQIGALAGGPGAFVSGGSGAGGGSIIFQVGNKNVTSTYAGTLRDGSTKSALTKVGTGNQILTGTNTYTGVTAVSAGTLTIGDGGSLNGTPTITVSSGGALAATGSGVIGNPRIVLNSGGTFDVTGATSTYATPAANSLSGGGTVVGNYAHSGGTLIPATDGTAGTLTFANNLSLAGGTVLWDLKSAGVVGGGSNDLVSVGGNLDLTSPSTARLTFLASPNAGDTFPLLSYGSETGSLANLSIAAGVRGVFNVVNDTANKLISVNVGTVITGAANLTWSGAVSNVWDTNGATNWTTGGGGATFFAGDNVTFDDTGAGQASVSLNSTVLPGVITFNGNSSYTIGGTGSIAGTAAIIKNGTDSTTTISTSNSYSGGTTINAGTVAITNNNALGTGSVTLNNGVTLNVDSVAPQGNTLNIPAGATATVTGGSGGGQTGIGTLVGGGIVNIVGTNVFDLRGDASAFTGTVAISGTGGVRINQSVATWNAGSAVFDLNEGLTVRNSTTTSVVLGGLKGGSGGVLSGSGGSGNTTAVTYTIGGLNLDTQFDGTVQDGANTTSITKVGTGNLVLTGNNTSTGTTTVGGGTLTLVGTGAAAQVLGTGTTTGGADVAGGRLVFDYTGGTSPAATVQPLLAAAHAGGFTTGQIRSSTATSSKGLGWLDDSANSKLTVAPALYGDSNIDGKVDLTDFTFLAANFNKVGGSVWLQGDYNYDGNVDLTDFTFLASNFNQSLSADGGGGGATTSLGGLVPEPASLGVLAVLGGTLLARRRRR